MKKFLTLFAMMVCAVSLYAKDLKVLYSENAMREL